MAVESDDLPMRLELGSGVLAENRKVPLRGPEGI
jgi:hypothetical protein